MESTGRITGPGVNGIQRLFGVEANRLQDRQATHIEIVGVDYGLIEYVVHLNSGESERIRDRTDDFIEWYASGSPQWEDTDHAFVVDSSVITLRYQGEEIACTREALNDLFATILDSTAIPSESLIVEGDSPSSPIWIQRLSIEEQNQIVLRGAQGIYHLTVLSDLSSFQELLQCAVIGQPYRVDNQWVSFNTATRVDSTTGTESSLHEYVRSAFRSERPIVHPEDEGKLVLDFGSRSILGKITLAGQTLERFKEAMRTNQPFPLIIHGFWCAVEANGLRSVLGVDFDHPRQVVEVTFTLPNHREGRVVGSCRFLNQDPVMEGGRRLGDTKESIQWSIAQLANWMARGRTRFSVGSRDGAIHYQFTQLCQVTIKSHDGYNLVDSFAWCDSHRQRKAAVAIQRLLTTCYGEARSVCVLDKTWNKITLRIGGKNITLEGEAEEDFSQAMDVGRPYTLWVGNEPITISREALYAREKSML